MGVLASGTSCSVVPCSLFGSSWFGSWFGCLVEGVDALTVTETLVSRKEVTHSSSVINEKYKK